MSRIIKFRCTYTDSKNWIKKDFTLAELMNGECFDVLSDQPLLKGYQMKDSYQFTGLLDKNGREIYEGDIVTNPFNKNVEIVKYDLFVDDPDYSLGKVLGFCVNNMCGLGYDIEGKMSFEIIGNIYENPELLNQ